MQVREIMSQDVTCCTPDSRLEEAAAMMVRCDCGAIPVVELGSRRAIGVVTDRDITCRAVARGLNPLGMRVEEVMSMPITCVTPDADVEEAVRRMEDCQIRRLPVVDSAGVLCGIVAQADIARAMPEHETAELVKDVSKPSQRPSQVQ